MKLYNCPDCIHTEDICENCIRYQMYHRTNIAEINISWPYYEILTSSNIPPACRKCPNHPSDGESGNCNCVLGDWPIIC